MAGALHSGGWRCSPHRRGCVASGAVPGLDPGPHGANLRLVLEVGLGGHGFLRLLCREVVGGQVPGLPLGPVGEQLPWCEDTVGANSTLRGDP